MTSPVGIVERVAVAAGSVEATASWVPAVAGRYQVRCVAEGMSSSTATGGTLMPVFVTSPLLPYVAAVAVDPAVVLVGKATELRVTALDPEGGALRYAWSAAAGSIVGRGDAATWTAPAAEGVYTVEVAITDDTGLTTRRSIPVEASTEVFTDTAGATVFGPRRMAATSDGEVFVVDARGRLNKLSKRGDLMATAHEGIVSVAFARGLVYAGTATGDLLSLDPVTGRVAGRQSLGVERGPVGLSYDSPRDLLWMAFASGMVQARRADGSVAQQIVKTSAGSLVRVADLAVDPATGIVWVAQDARSAGGMIFGFRAADGVQVKVLGADGAGPVERVGALAVGPGSHLYVADRYSGRVVVLDGAGASVRQIGSYGRAAGQLAQPSGLAFMANGDLLVANMDAGRVDRFGSESALPSCEGDADCDGLPDAWESANGLNPNDASDALVDLDGDGLTAIEEYRAGSNVAVADTDGDGFSDGDEVAARFNPVDATDHIAKLAASGSSGGPGLVRLAGSIGGLPVEVPCVQAWTQVEGPQVALVGADTLAPSFVARTAGTYRFSLEATCGGVAAIGAVAAVNIDNVAPLADAGRVVVVDAGARLALSAAASSDANGDTLTYSWEQVAGSAVTGPVAGRALTANFRVPGLYAFAMTARDRAGATTTAEAKVVVLGGTSSVPPAASVVPQAAPGAPVAVASAPAIAAVNAVSVLDGSASAGAGTYAWRQVSGPAAGLRNADAARADAFFFEPGSYLFELTVSNGAAASLPAFVRVEARAAGKAIPVAVATAQASAVVGERVVLDGAASVDAKNFRWTQVAGPWAVLTGGARAAFVAPAVGIYGFELEVDDGQVRSAPVRVDVVVTQNGMEN